MQNKSLIYLNYDWRKNIFCQARKFKEGKNTQLGIHTEIALLTAYF